MPSTRKTFTDGEVLTAQDVNNALNPSTADHLATNVHLQLVTVSINNARYGDANITFPAGRFTTTPIPLAAVYASGGDVSATARAWATSATAGVVRVGVPANATTSVQVAVFAVQMKPNGNVG